VLRDRDFCRVDPDRAFEIGVRMAKASPRAMITDINKRRPAGSENVLPITCATRLVGKVVYAYNDENFRSERYAGESQRARGSAGAGSSRRSWSA